MSNVERKDYNLPPHFQLLLSVDILDPGDEVAGVELLAHRIIS